MKPQATWQILDNTIKLEAREKKHFFFVVSMPISTFKHEYKCPLGLTYFQCNSSLSFIERRSIASAMYSAKFSDK